MRICSTESCTLTRLTRKSLSSSRVFVPRSAKRRLTSRQTIRLPRCLRLSRSSLSTTLRLLLIQTTRESVMRLFVRFMPLFMRSSTRFIPTISQRLTIACISSRSSSFAAGFLMRASVLTAVESTRFVRLTQRLTSSAVFTVQVCSLAVRHSVFQSQRSDL